MLKEIMYMLNDMEDVIDHCNYTSLENNPTVQIRKWIFEDLHNIHGISIEEAEKVAVSLRLEINHNTFDENSKDEVRKVIQKFTEVLLKASTLMGKYFPHTTMVERISGMSLQF